MSLKGSNQYDRGGGGGKWSNGSKSDGSSKVLIIVLLVIILAAAIVFAVNSISKSKAHEMEILAAQQRYEDSERERTRLEDELKEQDEILQNQIDQLEREKQEEQERREEQEKRDKEAAKKKESSGNVQPNPNNAGRHVYAPQVYFDSAIVMHVNAPGGYAAYMFYTPYLGEDWENDVKEYAYQGSAISVWAEENGYYYGAFDNGRAGWLHKSMLE